MTPDDLTFEPEELTFGPEEIEEPTPVEVPNIEGVVSSEPEEAQPITDQLETGELELPPRLPGDVGKGDEDAAALLIDIPLQEAR
jgi:hypothetical protein